MININCYYFFLLWALFSIFNSSYLLNFSPYIDPTLIMVVALSVLNTERIIIIFLIFILLFTQIFGSYISFFDLFLKFFFIVLGYLYNDKFYLEKLRKWDYFDGSFTLNLLFNCTIFRKFFWIDRLFSLLFICNHKFYI